MTQATVPPDVRALHFLLDLEYLQAEFYLRAQDGRGLDEADRGEEAGRVVGGRRVAFASPLADAFVRATANEERNHVRALRDLISRVGGVPNPAPDIDLGSSFPAFAIASGLCHKDQTFDAFYNEANLLLAAYIVEDVCATAYIGALSSIVDPYCREIVVGIMAAEAAQSAIVRFMLFSAGHGDPTNAISMHRQRLTGLMGTAFQGNDHGVGTLAVPSIAALDGRSIFHHRTPQQCRQILCGNTEGKPGLFFPAGLGESVEKWDPFTTIADATLALVGDRAVVEQIAYYPSERVEIPALPFTAAGLASYDIRENVPVQPWSETSYVSHAPQVLRLRDAIVHGAVGIVAIGRQIIDETLWHTDPARHRYSRDGQGVVLHARRVETLEGTTVTTLVGGAENYWHSLIDATARLGLVRDEIWQEPARVLLPSTGVKQEEFFALFGLPEWVTPRVVLPTETLRVETLIYPSSLHGLFNYHPSLLNKCFDRLLSNLPASETNLPKRVFIDRRGSPLRKLVNEEDLIAALPGFTPVKLETLSLVEQIRLFAEAEIIVAPHGAGLTNIGFCRPGTVVVEMMMDTYCNWCYRRIAALRGLVYRSVLGRSLDAWKTQSSLHLQTWSVDVVDLAATLAEAEKMAREPA